MTALDAVTAYHEAGHAVASCLRGGSSLTSVGFEPGHGTGLTMFMSKPCDIPFMAFAGPYAEARHAWGDRPLDGEDDDCLTLDDYVMGVLLTQPDDRQLMAGRYESVVWPMEIDRVWGAVEAVALLLLSGDTVTHDDVARLVDR